MSPSAHTVLRLVRAARVQATFARYQARDEGTHAYHTGMADALLLAASWVSLAAFGRLMRTPPSWRSWTMARRHARDYVQPRRGGDNRRTGRYRPRR